MKKTNITIIIILTILAVFYLSYDTAFEYLYGYPKDFNFALKYGVKGLNKVDTFKDTITKDTVEGLKTIKLKLTHEDMKKIYNEMKNMDILNMPTKFEKRREMYPVGLYSLRINFNGKERQIEWTSNDFMPIDISFDEVVIENEETGVSMIEFVPNNKKEKDEEYIKLEKLSKLKIVIQNIIEDKRKVKQLPESNLYL
ncbi:hypothetical protein [Dethiothermospora halolimnae]|uniref:hypothetical protein n=1 Tax=Dethiothermospora halolimnae TaxID=3114390 RepID=UPI003CCBBF43